MSIRHSVARAAPLFGPARRDYRSALSDIAALQRLDARQHLQLALQWLAAAQRPDGGFSRGFSLLTARWDRSYPETTGYIIPTLYLCAEVVDCDVPVRQMADSAANWLTSVQHADGYFSDLDCRKPQVFDTAQCLEGLCAAITAGGLHEYQSACENAASWLVRLQNADGSWTIHTYNKTARTYYARVAAVLLTTGTLLNIPEATRAGIKGLAWAAHQQTNDGFFSHCHFDGKPALLHTLAYTCAALLRGYVVTGDQRLLKAVRAHVRGLLESSLATGNLPVEGYEDGWRPVNATRCCAGVAQYAVILLFLSSITSDGGDLRMQGLRFLDFLMRRQVKVGQHLGGSLPSSIPMCVGYSGSWTVNWPVKFFIDAIVLALNPSVLARLDVDARLQWLV